MTACGGMIAAFMRQMSCDMITAFMKQMGWA